MKQYLSPEQTAKLIELGFDRPKNRVIKQLLDRSTDSWITIGEEGDYSIGELIEMLPAVIREFGGCYLNIHREENAWYVYYNPIIAEVTAPIYSTNYTELIDALFEMLVLLKEEGAI